jgi:hypothetical protein
MRSEYPREREMLTNEVKRVFARICDCARDEWISRRARRITYEKMGWD